MGIKNTYMCTFQGFLCQVVCPLRFSKNQRKSEYQDSQNKVCQNFISFRFRTNNISDSYQLRFRLILKMAVSAQASQIQILNIRFVSEACQVSLKIHTLTVYTHLQNINTLEFWIYSSDPQNLKADF